MVCGGNLQIEDVPGEMTTTMVRGDAEVRDLMETCNYLRNASTCDKMYDDQVDSMCESLREGKAAFKEGDVLVYACGESEISKTIYLRMVKYRNTDEPNLLLSRGLAKLENGSFVRSSLTWSIRPGTEKDMNLVYTDIEFLNSSAKVEVLDNIRSFKGSRVEKWEQVVRVYGQDKMFLKYYAHLLNMIRGKFPFKFVNRSVLADE